MPIYALGDVEPDIDETAFVHPTPLSSARCASAPRLVAWLCAVLRGDHGWIEVGARTSIQDGTDPWLMVIGSECVVGHNAHLEGCVVEDRCLIGSGARSS